MYRRIGLLLNKERSLGLGNRQPETWTETYNAFRCCRRLLKEQVGTHCTFRGKRFFRHTFNSARVVDLVQRTHVNTSISSIKGPSVVSGTKGFSIGNSNPSVTNGNASHDS